MPKVLFFPSGGILQVENSDITDLPGPLNVGRSFSNASSAPLVFQGCANWRRGGGGADGCSIMGSHLTMAGLRGQSSQWTVDGIRRNRGPK